MMSFRWAAEERAGGQLHLRSADYLSEFRLEDGFPSGLIEFANGRRETRHPSSFAEYGSCQLTG